MITILVSAVNSFWIAAAAAVFVWALFRFVWQSNAATRHAAWWAVLVAVVAIPLAPRLDVTQRLAPPPSEPLASPSPVVMVADTTTTPVLAIPTPAIPALATPQAPVEMPGGSWIVWALGLWAAVFVYRIARVSHSYLYLRRIKNRAEPAPAELQVRFDLWRTRRARLLVSNEIASPMAVGFRHPAVILPEALLAELNQVELDHVLLHELAHLARRDDWTNLLARVTWATLGLHPVVAWSVSQLAKERELACDDWVVAQTGGEARPYAASLTRVFELSTARRGDLLASAMTSQLGSRVERLLARGRTFVPHVSIEAVAAGIVVLMGLVIAGAQSPQWIVFAQERARPVQRFEPVAPPRLVQREVAQARPVTPATPVERQGTLEFLGEREKAIRAMQEEIQAQEAQVHATRARMQAFVESQGAGSTQERIRAEAEVRAQEAQVHATEARMRALAESQGAASTQERSRAEAELRAQQAQLSAAQSRMRALAESQEARPAQERARAERAQAEAQLAATVKQLEVLRQAERTGQGTIGKLIRDEAEEVKLVELTKQLDLLKQIAGTGRIIPTVDEGTLSEAIRDLSRQLRDIDAQLLEVARDPAVSERAIQRAMIEAIEVQKLIQRSVEEQKSTMDQLQRAMAEIQRQIRAMREEKR